MYLRKRIFSRGERDDQIEIVGLYLCLVRRATARRAAAFFTAMQDDVAALGVRLGTDGTQGPATLVCSVSGVDIYVQRIEAKGTMVARGVAER